MGNTAWVQALQNDTRRIIHEHGTPIIYSQKVANFSSVDIYGAASISYTAYSVTAWVELTGQELATVVEGGILPKYGINVMISALDISFIPIIGDTIKYQTDSYEIRYVQPRQIEGILVYYKIEARQETTYGV